VNFLYCLDHNYNRQTYISISSICKHNPQKINVYIFHDEPDSFRDYHNKLLKNNINLNIQIMGIENEDTTMFRDPEYHVTRATYFRFLIEKYLPKNLENILYIDSDVFCIKNLKTSYEKIFTSLQASNTVIAAKTTSKRSIDDMPLFSKLNIDELYFNAGVLFINLNAWKDQDYTNQLFKKMQEIGNKATFHDQDILNSFINGKYIELNENLNFILNNKIKKIDLLKVKKSAILIHYAGSKKPWSLNGVKNEGSQFYQNLNLEFLGHYHLTHSYKKGDLFNLIKIMLSLKLFKLNKPIQFIKEALSGIVKT